MSDCASTLIGTVSAWSVHGQAGPRCFVGITTPDGMVFASEFRPGAEHQVETLAVLEAARAYVQSTRRRAA